LLLCLLGYISGQLHQWTADDRLTVAER
jgi:hypothetical protein